MDKNEELEYLMNPALYDKYLQLSSKERNLAFLEERQFYRKRIQQMAKDCSKFPIVKGAIAPPPALAKAFDYFSKVCIEHFKLIDEAEIYQNEYRDMQISKENHTVIESSEEKVDFTDFDTSLLSSSQNNHKKIVSMDDFVTKKQNKPKKPVHLPKQKIANVKDEKYRTKGLKKNKSKDIIGNANKNEK